MTLPPAEAALEYYFHGFLRTLRHHRAATIGGWIIAAAGSAGLFSACRAGSDPIDLGVPLCALGAGIALVHLSLVRLEAYIAVPFPPPDPAVLPPELFSLLSECAQLMEDVDAGGWQEAYAALRRLEFVRRGRDQDGSEPARRDP
jgi:hypothetical protein